MKTKISVKVKGNARLGERVSGALRAQFPKYFTLTRSLTHSLSLVFHFYRLRACAVLFIELCLVAILLIDEKNIYLGHL